MWECLAGGHAGDQLVVIRHHLAHGRVGQARAHQVAVDLVGDDPQVVLRADLADALQLFFRPDVACRVMGVAEQKPAYIPAAHLLLKIREVHLISAIRGAFQGGIDERTAQVPPDDDAVGPRPDLRDQVLRVSVFDPLGDSKQGDLEHASLRLPLGETGEAGV